MVTDLAGCTHIGLKRRENQDGYLAEVMSSPAGRPVACLAVADGMGGHEEGKRASAEAIESLRSELAVLVEGDRAGVGPSEAWLARLEEAAHSRVSTIAKEGQVVGTTLTVVLVSGEECVIGHVGDSRVYRYDGTALQQLTCDHTWEAYARLHKIENPYGHELRQAVGVGEHIDPDAFRVALAEGDWLMVCSDGLYKMVPEEKVERALRTARTASGACENLLALALQAGGRDNITVCLGRIGEPRHRPTRGTKDTQLLLALAIAVLALTAWALDHLLRR